MSVLDLWKVPLWTCSGRSGAIVNTCMSVKKIAIIFFSHLYKEFQYVCNFKEGSKFNTEKELSFYTNFEVNNEHQLQIRKRLKKLNKIIRRQRLKVAIEP